MKNLKNNTTQKGAMIIYFDLSLLFTRLDLKKYLIV